MTIHSYPKIYNMGHSAIQDLFKDEVIIEEKIDGSQFSFGVKDGELWCKSKGKDQSPGQTDKMFELAVEQVKERIDKLVANKLEGLIFRGEYLSKPKHNTLCYSRVPTGNIIIFDIDKGVEDYWAYENKEEIAGFLGFETVPILYQGKVSGYDEFVELLDTESILGSTKVEGVVVKNYHRYGRDGKCLMGKYVSPAFKEKHQKDWKVRNPQSQDIIEMIAGNLRTVARWQKAIFAQRDVGALTHTPKDIGGLIKDIQKDIMEEETEYIKDALYKWAGPTILKRCIRGFPEWYKDQLLQDQFTGE
jgi:hypothetical protein